jgi:hypothetical protein
MRVFVLRGVTPRFERSWAAAIGAGALIGCCRPPDAGSDEVSNIPYLSNRAFRRAEMLASLVNHDSGYAKQRDDHYATGRDGDWDRLREWNPATEPVASSELDSEGGASPTALSADATPLRILRPLLSEDDPALLDLGREAFRRYPVQLAPYLQVAVVSREAARRYGLWVDDRRGVGGLVRARVAGGSGAIALTCSTCHSSMQGANLVDGLSNAALDLGAAMVDASRRTMDASLEAAIASWGPGRVDVSSHTGKEPARIADIRPVAWLGYLQQDATVEQRTFTSLVIRIETLITTSHNETVRPPRVVALALAAYVRGMAKQLPDEGVAAAKFPAGKAVFESHCIRCHVPPSLTGPPVPLGVIGTNPTLGLSPDRGTGAYRVPSLHGVGTRGPLLHDGTLSSLQAMFDPARLITSRVEPLHGSGPTPGHPYGLDLDEADRVALVSYLRAL